jgi:hypothetical protein
LLGICFWREGLEGAFGPERRGGERGLITSKVARGSLDGSGGELLPVFFRRYH